MFQVYKIDIVSDEETGRLRLVVGEIYAQLLQTEDEAQAVVDELTATIPDPNSLTHVYGYFEVDHEPVKVGDVLLDRLPRRGIH